MRKLIFWLSEVAFDKICDWKILNHIQFETNFFD